MLPTREEAKTVLNAFLSFGEPDDKGITETILEAYSSGLLVEAVSEEDLRCNLMGYADEFMKYQDGKYSIGKITEILAKALVGKVVKKEV